MLEWQIHRSLKVHLQEIGLSLCQHVIDTLPSRSESLLLRSSVVRDAIATVRVLLAFALEQALCTMAVISARDSASSFRISIIVVALPF